MAYKFYSLKFKILFIILYFNFLNSVNLNIRVLIEKVENKIVYTLESESGFLIKDPKFNKIRYINNKKIDLKIIKNIIYINNKKYNYKNIYILNKSQNIKYKENFFSGYFQIKEYNNDFLIINHVNLEDYVSTVLPSESWPGWPDEVNKALSICIRSYAASKILENKNKKGAYDVKNNTFHLVYKGYKDKIKLKNIVEQTKDIIIAYNNKPIIAMFDISCGAIIPAKLSNINFKNSPYLSRSYKCNYCKDYKCFYWQITYDKKELFALLQKKLNIKNIEDISIYEKDLADTVTNLIIKTKNNNIIVNINKIKNLLKLKSTYFNLEKNKKFIIFNGKGFGHLVGLCQFGLRQMIKEGWNYKKALNFYYPGTKLMKLAINN